jgi:acetolactate synthase-1/2/3 large subunit
MGYALPAAIGAQVARPDKQVWAVAGDGAFQQTLQELAILNVYHIPVKVALINNEFLGMVRQQQVVQYDGNIVQVDLAGTPDFVKLAEAYGIPAWRVTQPGDLADAIVGAMAYPVPAIVEFRVAREENVYPWVLGGSALGDVIPDTPYRVESRPSSNGHEKALEGAHG